MLNPHFAKLQSRYIFPIIEEKLLQLQKEKPRQKIFNLGVGDISLPLAPPIAKAISKAAEEMTRKTRGYGPCSGYPFLKKAICAHKYAQFGFNDEEIFISEGANTDISSISELFAPSCTIGVVDPTYPVYYDANLIAGKTMVTLTLKEEDGFLPFPPKRRLDLIYLCTPSNPTGIALPSKLLSEWITWAKKHRSILIIDSVYDHFISSDGIPPSIYFLEGAREVAIEIGSFSKWAGFTGLRCGYTAIPKTLHIPSIHKLWQTRLDIKTNGISYPIQKGAAACFTKEAIQILQEQLRAYKKSGEILREALSNLEQIFYGGIDAPYIWWKCPEGLDSWTFCDLLLNHSHIVAIPGVGFGPNGEGFVRLSSFVSPNTAREAADALHHHFATI